MKYKCSMCGKEISRKVSLYDDIFINDKEMICLSCIKETDPFVYLFVLKAIKNNLTKNKKVLSKTLSISK